MTWRKASSDAVEQHFSYDDEHRVSEVRFDGHKEFSRVEYRYDAVGRRTRKILHRHGRETETITFLWSGLRMVGESSSLTPERNTQYIYSENSWEPLARVDSIGEQSETFWYHTELNGLPERMTDAHGEVVWRGRFSTWGETERESVTGFQAVPQNLRFQGQYLDRETGLHYNLFRYYDPVGGRFTQVDPIGLAGGVNTYSYVVNPVTIVDPLGLMPLSNPINQGHHMVPHEVATHLDIVPFNSQTNVPAMYWDDSQWSSIEHSAMHGYNGIGTNTKPLVKPAAVIKSGLSKEEWLNSLEKHYNNPDLKNIRGDVHLITSSGKKGLLLAKNVTAPQAWEVTKNWARKMKCGGK